MWEKFLQEKKKIDPEMLGDKLEKLGIRIITRDNYHFSKLLLQISSIPCILYYCGDISLLNQDSLAVVGARRATPYGLEQAKRMAGQLALQGLVIVSGLARGIDGAAQGGALGSGGKTTAVLGSSLDIPYPRENLKLFQSVCQEGLVISEFPLGTPPIPRNFPIRNRIISGLSLGVFVIEAQARSGSLITCDCALDQGRDVFALPGPVTSAASIGPLQLVQKGAKLVIFIEDILEELNLEYRDNLFIRKKTIEQHISKNEKGILKDISWHPVHIDDILKKCNTNVPLIHETLLELELKGLIKQLPGKYYVRI